jgi:hypothetical protein
VTSNPPGIDCGIDCSETYGVGTVVTLTASADVSSGFMGWGGACNGTGGCVVAMDALKAVTAAFSLKTYVGTMTKTGNGSGSVNMTPPGIDCGMGCNAITRTFEHGTMVTLTPMADSGSIFVGWTGACAGTGVCVVTMDGPRQTMATFKLTRNLAVSKAGSGSGTVISSPAGIACGGGTCNAPFTDGAVVTVTASAGAFSYFTGWTGACTGVGQCVVTMNANKTVTATFTLQTFPLIVIKAGTGSGTVASNPAGINCGDTCGALFPASSVVIVTATASTFSNFSGWGGVCAGAEPCVVTMNAAKAVTATFTLRTFPLTVSKAGIGIGTVTSTPAGINCGNTCNADFSGGTGVTLTATPDAGASFSSWSGACSGSGPCAVTMDAAKDVTATFGVPGAVTPQASTMYYGQQLQIEGEAMAAAPAAVTKLVVFTGTVPAGIFLVGVEGSEPYASEIAAGRLINRLLAEGCGTHGECAAVNVAVYAPDGTHTDFVVTSPVSTEYLYLPHVRR